MNDIEQEIRNSKNFQLKSSILGSLLQSNRQEYHDGTLIDDKCIKQNVFNFVQSPSLRRDLKSNNNIYQITTPTEFNRTQTYENKGQYRSILTSATQKSSQSITGLKQGKFRDFDSIKEYFHHYDTLKHKFDVNDLNILNQMEPNEFLILHQLFPKIYSIKQKSSNREIQEQDFNPSNLTQCEIFLVKSEVYIHTEQWEKAQFFMQQGQKVWGSERSFEFRYNQGLLYYLTGEYERSSKVYQELFDNMEMNQDSNEKFNAVLHNYIISLLRIFSFDQILEISEKTNIKKIRMNIDPEETKLQKLIIFAEQNKKKKRILKLEKDQAFSLNESPPKVRHDKTIEELKICDNPINSIRDLNKEIKLISFKKFTKGKRQKCLRGISLIEKDQDQNVVNVRVKRTSKAINQTTLEQKASNRTRNYQTSVVNKARFDIEQIQDTSSSKYVLSMNQIIEKLNLKGGIQNNKHLQYQLNNLDEIVNENHQNKATFKKDKELKSREIIAFPFQKSPNMTQNPYNQVNEDSHKFNLADQCLRNLEELELEVAISNGGSNMEKFDPILIHYKALCHSIYNLCQEEGLFEILQQAADHRKNNRNKIKRKALYPGSKPKEVKKFSVAKDILVSSLLRPRKGIVTLKSQNENELVEIEVLQNKVAQLKEVLKEEIDEYLGKNKSLEYIDQAENEINKMLAIARKKKREREKYQQQDQEDRLSPSLAIQQHDVYKEPTMDELTKNKPLQQILKKQPIQEEIARRFKVERQKYMLSLIKTQVQNQEDCGASQNILKAYNQTLKSEIDSFIQKSTKFLDYLFDTYGAFFIAQRTYCISEFLDFAPADIKIYFDNVASLLSTIPMRFEILTDNNIDDSQYSILENQEFVYNRYDLIYKLISQGMRQQRYIDYLGLEKHDWIIEVIQKFNLISIFNNVFREALSLYQVKQIGSQPISAEDRVSGFDVQFLNDINQKSIYNEQSLKVIREQFAKLKHQSYLNAELIDRLLGTKIQMFKQFLKPLRIQMYNICCYKTIKDHDELDFSEILPSSILVLIHGTLILQTKLKEDSKWDNFQTFNSGTAIPCQFLYYMKLKYHQVRLLMERKLKLHSEFEDIEYLEMDKTKLSKIVFSQVKNTLVQKIQLMQNVDILGGYSGQVEKNDMLSPYAIFVLASLCKVQIFKFSEVISRQNEIPKGMHIFLEGQGKAVFEDLLQRKGDVSEFFRKSMKTTVPKSLHFGTLQNNKILKHRKNIKSVGHNQQQTSKSKERNEFLTPDQSFKYSSQKAQLEQVQQIQYPIIKEFSITFQNLVLNEKWTEHQTTQQISYKHHITFEQLQEGSYFGSRIVLDEAAVRNFIKIQQSEIRSWISLPGQVWQDQGKQSHSRFSHDNLDEHYNTSRMDQFSEDGGMFSSKMFHSRDQRLSIFDKQEDQEYQQMKNYLLRSQLTVLATSSIVKVIVIKRSDKGYFNETTKKILDERIQDKEYLDVDRPIKKLKNLEKIREKEKDWDRYKVQYEESCIKESFHQRFDKQLFK